MVCSSMETKKEWDFISKHGTCTLQWEHAWKNDQCEPQELQHQELWLMNVSENYNKKKAVNFGESKPPCQRFGGDTVKMCQTFDHDVRFS